MSGMLQSLIRWLRRPDFSDLPTTTVESAAVTDDDTDQWGDSIYLRCLLDDLVQACRDTHEATAKPLPAEWSAVLALTLEEVRDDAFWELPLAVIV